VHLKLKEIIKDEGNKDIGYKTDGYDKKVFELTADEQDKQEKKYNRKDCPVNVL
jgi:hypothetical protein